MIIKLLLKLNHNPEQKWNIHKDYPDLITVDKTHVNSLERFEQMKYNFIQKESEFQTTTGSKANRKHKAGYKGK